MTEDYKSLVKQYILTAGTFVKATFSGRQKGHDLAWNQVIVRPVLIQEERQFQVSHFDDKQDVTKNFADAQVEDKLDELLSLPFKNITVQTTQQQFHVQITKKGQAIVHQHREAAPQRAPSLEHNRPKNLLLPADTPDPFLHTTGIMTQDGRVRANMQKKFRQINEFLQRIVETGELENLEKSPVQIIDCGCGSAQLTFAVYHYLNHVLNLPAALTGVDVNESLLKKQAELGQSLGWKNLHFAASPIVDYQPDVVPDIVLALHACDTATDEALAQAIKWQSYMIFAVPCCHHHLHRQLVKEKEPPPFQPVLQHGVFKQRWGDMLTDTFRGLILQILGYRTDVVEFVSTEHTGKNLMIRAVKTDKPAGQQAVQEYLALRDFWQVQPYLADLLANELAALGV
jgi:SAM-dependent methyltransferase